AGALTELTARTLGADSHQGSIHIAYEVPKDPAQQETYRLVRRHGTLEMLQRTFSPFRLSADLIIKTVDCDGISDAYFSRTDDGPTIRICYEFLQEVHESTPRQGITPDEAFVGQLLFAVAHEFGHALFDIYEVPVFGRHEDAADQFAAYFLLQFGDERARQLI